LLKQAAGLFLLKFVLGCDVTEQLPIATVLHYQEKSAWSLNNLIQLDDVRVVYDLKDVNFPSDTLTVIHISNLILLKNFNSHFLVGENMDSFLDLAEGALT